MIMINLYISSLLWNGFAIWDEKSFLSSRLSQFYPALENFLEIHLIKQEKILFIPTVYF